MHAQKVIVPCPAIAVQSATPRSVSVAERPAGLAAFRGDNEDYEIPSQVNPLGNIHGIADTKFDPSLVKVIEVSE